MNTDFDVIVVGGGPSGSLTAYGAASAGYRVLVVDKASFPRFKPCAGGLTMKSLNWLPFSVAPILQRMTATVHFAHRYDTPRLLRGQGPICGFVVRREFDMFLLDKARAAGAEFLVKDGIARIDPDADGVAVRFADGAALRAKFLVGADGANSLVRRLCFDPSWFRRGFAIEGLIHDRDLAARQEMEINFAVVPGGYGWLFPKKDHVNAGIFVHTAACKLRKNDLRAYVREKIGDCAIDHITGFPIGLGGHGYRSSHGRLILVGDAGGFGETLFGEGLHHAIKTGVIAGDCLARVLAADRSDLHNVYGRRLRDIRHDLKVCDALATRFYGSRSGTKASAYPGIVRRVLKNNFMRGVAAGKTTSTIIKYFILAPLWNIPKPDSVRDFQDK